MGQISLTKLAYLDKLVKYNHLKPYYSVEHCEDLISPFSEKSGISNNEEFS